LQILSSELPAGAGRAGVSFTSVKGVATVTRIMNVDEVARYLGVVPDTIYRKARRGEIPAVKVGKMWRFPKETLDKWLNDAALEAVLKKS